MLFAACLLAPPAQAADRDELAEEIRSLRLTRDALLEEVARLELKAVAMKERQPGFDACSDPSLWLNPQAAVDPARAAATDDAAAPSRRVFVHYSMREPGAERLARTLARQLAERGFSVPELRPVPLAIERPSVRFFFTEDRPASLEVRKLVAPLLPRAQAAAPLRLLDLRGYEPKPRDGTLELWVTANPS